MDRRIRHSLAAGLRRCQAQLDCPTALSRVAADRRQALVEIDALVALMLGPDRRRTVHDLPHPVPGPVRLRPQPRLLRRQRPPGAEHGADRVAQEGRPDQQDERTATNQAGNTYTYELPFVTLDREETCGRRTRSSSAAGGALVSELLPTVQAENIRRAAWSTT